MKHRLLGTTRGPKLFRHTQKAVTLPKGKKKTPFELVVTPRGRKFLLERRFRKSPTSQKKSILLKPFSPKKPSKHAAFGGQIEVRGDLVIKRIGSAKVSAEMQQLSDSARQRRITTRVVEQIARLRTSNGTFLISKLKSGFVELTTIPKHKINRRKREQIYRAVERLARRLASKGLLPGDLYLSRKATAGEFWTPSVFVSFRGGNVRIAFIDSSTIPIPGGSRKIREVFESMKIKTPEDFWEYPAEESNDDDATIYAKAYGRYARYYNALHIQKKIGLQEKLVELFLEGLRDDLQLPEE